MRVLFGVEETIMIIYGANLGSSVITAFLSWNLRGRSLQIAMFQVSFNAVGCAILVPLFYLEVYGDVPLVRSLLVWLTPQIDLQLAWLYLLFNIAAAIPLLLAIVPVSGLLERVSPSTRIEDFSRPQFIYDAAMLDPETALELILREQRRELENLPVFLENLGSGRSHGQGSLEDRLNAYTMLSSRISEFINALGA